jgi:hypothetical protein
MSMIFPNLVTHHVYDGCRLPPFDAQAYQYILAGNGVRTLFVRAEMQYILAGNGIFAILFRACARCRLLVRGLAPLQPSFG